MSGLNDAESFELITAVLNNKLEEVHRLLQNHHRNPRALHIACRKGLYLIVAMFLAQGICDLRAVEEAQKAGERAIVELILSSGLVTEPVGVARSQEAYNPIMHYGSPEKPATRREVQNLAICFQSKKFEQLPLEVRMVIASYNGVSKELIGIATGAGLSGIRQLLNLRQHWCQLYKIRHQNSLSKYADFIDKMYVLMARIGFAYAQGRLGCHTDSHKQHYRTLHIFVKGLEHALRAVLLQSDRQANDPDATGEQGALCFFDACRQTLKAQSYLQSDMNGKISQPYRIQHGEIAFEIECALD